MGKAHPSPELLRKVLRYEPDTGKLYWRERPVEMFNDTPCRSTKGTCAMWNARLAGKEAFIHTHAYGYRTGCVLRVQVTAHRVIWAIVHGEWPEADIDHINGIRDDNRLANLRSVTRQENMKNQKIRSTNTSGVVGVYWKKLEGLWEARIFADGKLLFLGAFAKKADAISARKGAEKLYDYHENHGRKVT